MSDKQPDDTRICPDCAAENSDDGRRPLTEFYRFKAAGYAGGYRYSPYCKTHTKKRNAQAARDAPEGSQRRETQRRVKRDWARQHPENARTNSANYRSRKQKAAEEVEQSGQGDQVNQGDEPSRANLGEQLGQVEE